MIIKSMARLHRVTKIHQSKNTLRVYTSVLHFFIRTALKRNSINSADEFGIKCSVLSTEFVWSWLAEAQSAINTAEKYKITNFLLPNRLCYQGGAFRVYGVFLDLREGGGAMRP